MYTSCLTGLARIARILVGKNSGKLGQKRKEAFESAVALPSQPLNLFIYKELSDNSLNEGNTVEQLAEVDYL